MKIAFVSQPFEYVTPDTQPGSVGILTRKIVNVLSAEGCQSIIYSRIFPGLEAEETDGLVVYKRFSVQKDTWRGKIFKLMERILRYPKPKLPFFATTQNYSNYIKQIAQDLQNQDCDIVHVHNFSQFVPVIRQYNPDVKIVLHMHCEWLSQLDATTIQGRLEDVDLVIGCSHYITDKVQNRFPGNPDKYTTVFNGFDASVFNQLSDDSPEIKSAKKLLFVGRISPEKGVHVLLDAMEYVIEEHPDVQLDIVGAPGNAAYEYIVLVSDDENVKNLDVFYDNWMRKGDYITDIKEKMSAKVAAHVNFVGAVSHEEIGSYYQQSDILINPSLSEAFGMSLVEAMACRKPVVATNVGGMTEIVEEGETGFLVEPNNPKMLATAINRLLDSAEIRSQMGATGQQKAMQTYTWEHIVHNLHLVYEAQS